MLGTAKQPGEAVLEKDIGMRRLGEGLTFLTAQPLAQLTVISLHPNLTSPNYPGIQGSWVPTAGKKEIGFKIINLAVAGPR